MLSKVELVSFPEEFDNSKECINICLHGFDDHLVAGKLLLKYNDLFKNIKYDVRVFNSYVDPKYRQLDYLNDEQRVVSMIKEYSEWKAKAFDCSGFHIFQLPTLKHPLCLIDVLNLKFASERSFIHRIVGDTSSFITVEGSKNAEAFLNNSVFPTMEEAFVSLIEDVEIVANRMTKIISVSEKYLDADIAKMTTALAQKLYSEKPQGRLLLEAEDVLGLVDALRKELSEDTDDSDEDIEEREEEIKRVKADFSFHPRKLN